MKRILILIIILLNMATIRLYSQCVTVWTQRYDSGGTDGANGIAVDNSGNVYVTGYISTGIASDYYTIKYDSSGNTIWTQRYDSGWDNDCGEGISVDNNGNVYVTGYAGLIANYYTIKYDGSNGNTIQTQVYDGGDYDRAYSIYVDSNGYIYISGESRNSTSDYDFFTIKYSNNGNTIWTQRYNGNTNNYYSRGICVDSAENVYVSGMAGSGFFTIKYNNLGNTIWTQRGCWDKAYGIAVDNNGYVYVTGYTNGHDYYTIKYDGSSGNTVWAQKYDGGNTDISYGIAVDNNGYIYVTGYANNGSNDDYFTIKYDSSGNTIWTQRYDSGKNDVANGIAVDSSGNVYVTGYSHNGADGDYYTIKYEQSPYPSAPSVLSAGEKNGYIEIKWSDNTINERGFKIYHSYDGISYEIIGRVTAGITVYNDTGYNESRTNYYRVSATNLAGEIMSSNSVKWAGDTVSESREYGINDVVLVPNPFHYGKEEDRGKITFYKASEGISIEIYSISGRKIKELRYENEGEDNKIEWGVRDEAGRELSTGIYIAKIEDENENKRYITFSVRR